MLGMRQRYLGIRCPFAALTFHAIFVHGMVFYSSLNTFNNSYGEVVMTLKNNVLVTEKK